MMAMIIILGKYTHHSTFAAEERIQARKHLLSSPYMLSLLEKIFYTDYQLFRFSPPNYHN